MNCQQLVLVGDAHLGRESPDTEAALLEFLDAVPGLGDGLLVTGDLFEFWFTWGRAVPRQGLRVASALAGLGRRLPVLLLGGNHDRWGAGFWDDDLGLRFATGEARFTLQGRPALALHGDGLLESHWSAALLGRILRHPATIRMYAALHPDLGLWLVDHVSGVLGDRDRTPEEIATGATRQEAWARARLEAEPDLQLVVMGHTHWPAQLEVGPGRRYVNPGAWFDGYRYAVVTPGAVSLTRFPG